jgi:ABC-type sulfate transport system permease component
METMDTHFVLKNFFRRVVLPERFPLIFQAISLRFSRSRPS